MEDMLNEYKSVRDGDLKIGQSKLKQMKAQEKVIWDYCSRRIMKMDTIQWIKALSSKLSSIDGGTSKTKSNFTFNLYDNYIPNPNPDWFLEIESSAPFPHDFSENIYETHIIEEVTVTGDSHVHYFMSDAFDMLMSAKYIINYCCNGQWTVNDIMHADNLHGNGSMWHLGYVLSNYPALGYDIPLDIQLGFSEQIYVYDKYTISNWLFDFRNAINMLIDHFIFSYGNGFYGNAINEDTFNNHIQYERHLYGSSSSTNTGNNGNQNGNNNDPKEKLIEHLQNDLSADDKERLNFLRDKALEDKEHAVIGYENGSHKTVVGTSENVHYHPHISLDATNKIKFIVHNHIDYIEEENNKYRDMYPCFSPGDLKDFYHVTSDWNNYLADDFFYAVISPKVTYVLVITDSDKFYNSQVILESKETTREIMELAKQDMRPIFLHHLIKGQSYPLDPRVKRKFHEKMIKKYYSNTGISILRSFNDGKDWTSKDHWKVIVK